MSENEKNAVEMSQDELVGIADLYCESNIVEMPNLSDDEDLVFTALLENGWSVADAVKVIVENRNPDDHPSVEPVEEGFVPDPQDMRFHITDESSSNWVLRKIAEAKAQLDGLQAMRDAEVAIIDRKMAKLMRPINQTIQYFTLTYEQELAAFTAEKIKLGKKKSIALLNGTLGFRKQQDQVVLDIDDEEVIRLIKQIGPEQEGIAELKEAVKVKEYLVTTPIKKMLAQKDGDVSWSGMLFDQSGVSDDNHNQPVIQVAHLESRPDKFYLDAVLPVDEDVHPWSPPRRVEVTAGQEDS